jgi:hypothetical protein
MWALIYFYILNTHYQNPAPAPGTHSFPRHGHLLPRDRSTCTTYHWQYPAAKEYTHSSIYTFSSDLSHVETVGAHMILEPPQASLVTHMRARHAHLALLMADVRATGDDPSQHSHPIFSPFWLVSPIWILNSSHLLRCHHQICDQSHCPVRLLGAVSESTVACNSLLYPDRTGRYFPWSSINIERVRMDSALNLRSQRSWHVFSRSGPNPASQSLRVERSGSVPNTPIV